MQKAFENFLWKNYPETDTPLGKLLLNRMNNGIDITDDRVIVLDGTKAEKTELSDLFSDASFDENSGIIKLTRKGGGEVIFDIPISKIKPELYYDPISEKLILPTFDGTPYEVDLSKLITQNEFLDSDTIYFTVELKEEIAFSSTWLSNAIVLAQAGNPISGKSREYVLIESDVEISNISGTYKKKGENENIPIVFAPTQSDPKHIFIASFPGGAFSYEISVKTEENLEESEKTEKIIGYYSKSGTVKAGIKEGSIQEKHLRPDYLADIRLEATKAEQSKNSATESAAASEKSAEKSKEYSDKSKEIYDNFQQAGTVTGVKGNAESSFHTGNVNITPANIGSPSNEYMEEHFVPDCISHSSGDIKDKGWYRIAKASIDCYFSCTISLKRGYGSGAPEYQLIQLLDTYEKKRFVSLIAQSSNHMWEKIRLVKDTGESSIYIEIYQNKDTPLINSWSISIWDATGIRGFNWKAIAPVKVEEVASGITVLASMDLPANFDLTYLAKKDGSNTSGTWGINISGNADSATKATQDSDGNVIKDNYAASKIIINSDFNNMITPGLYTMVGCANAPSGGSVSAGLLVLKINSNSSVRQIAAPYTSDEIYVRMMDYTAGWGSWEKLQKGSINLSDTTGILSKSNGGTGTSNGKLPYNKLLWSGCYYMNEGQQANLSESVSSQPHGIVLIFSRFDAANTTALDYGYQSFFVPRALVELRGTSGTLMDFSMFGASLYAGCSKRLTIYNTYIKGDSTNLAEGTSASGIKYNNKIYVLRYVYGV